MNPVFCLESAWFKKSAWLVFLVPISWLFTLGVFVRRKCYDWGFLKRTAFKTPVIVVGNILIGGTGKTPFVIALVQDLQAKGLQVGVVSRGYKAQCQQFPHELTAQDEAVFVGDEPYLIKQNTQAFVVIDPDRPRGIQWLIDQYQPDVVICDDGLQHYALVPGLSIVLQPDDLVFSPYPIPAGPLREPLSRLSAFDLIVTHVDTQIEALSLDPSWRYNLMTAIARPWRVSAYIAALGIDATLIKFPDHHAFIAQDFANLSGPIIMTEKDWVKCKNLLIAQPVHVLKVRVILPDQVKACVYQYLGIAQ